MQISEHFSKPKDPRFKDLTGKRYGRWEVVSFIGDRKWLCQCQCGNFEKVYSHHLNSGKSISCGCFRKESLTKHNHASNGKVTSIYSAWTCMIDRCNNRNNSYYKNYGGRGITVCDRWLKSFQNFLQDIGDKPSSKHSLDRMDNNGNYCKENCRWATATEQQRNKSNTVRIEYLGENKTVYEWGIILGIKPRTILRRFYQGYGIPDILKKGRVCN